MFKTGALSGNTLKILAAVFMLVDHIGYMLFPRCVLLRMIGRLSFPIFAFMISEGCCHTKNRKRYFLRIFLLAAGCQIVYFAFDGSLSMGILVTFSLAIIMIFALENFKDKLFSKAFGVEIVLAAALFLFAVTAVYILDMRLSIDYGFWGCMTPLLASVFRCGRRDVPDVLRRMDRLSVHVLMTGLGLAVIAAKIGAIQWYSFLALPLLMLYSGKRGKVRMKNFFYIFYPAHLVILQGISMLMRR